MSTIRCNSIEVPNGLRPAMLRVSVGLVALVALFAFAARATAQAPVTSSASAVASSSLVAVPTAAPIIAPVPFAVGEELVFRATFGIIPAGTARMRVQGIDTVRGRPAYHVIYTLDGGIPLFRVHDRYESWIDRETLSSLRHRQEISEGRYHRNTTYEIFPERAEYQKDGGEMQPSVSNPLDDGSFIYAIRATAIRVGETRRDDRYFRPDRNPVVLTGLREDTVSVAAGTFATTVIRPTIKANGIFSENGEAQVWFSADERRIPVQLKTRFAKFSLTLALQSVTNSEGTVR
jgi:hypothetical protein